MIPSNRFARIALRIARATKLWGPFSTVLRGRPNHDARKEKLVLKRWDRAPKASPESCGTFTTLRAQRLGPAFGRTDFSRIFIFWAAGFFRGFSRRIFSPHFCGKKCQKKPPGKSPGKSSKIYTTKILQHISADWPGQQRFKHQRFPE